MIRLLHDETGVVTTGELLILGTLLFGIAGVGFVVLRDSMVQELGDVAEAAGAVSNTYDLRGVRKRDSAGNVLSGNSGSAFIDETDACDCEPVSFVATAPKVDPSGSFILEGN